jgi:hypothetical protein
MIQLKKGQTNAIVLSLTESQTLDTPNYLFYFVHRSQNNVVAFVLLNAEDVSMYKDRYNEFDLIVDDYFANAAVGEYEYFIYEQASTTNLIPNDAALLESGIMHLESDIDFSFTNYQTQNTFISR